MRERFSTAVYCNFCGKGANEVRKMIAAPGPEDVHICDQCVALMACAEADLAILDVRTQFVMREISKLSVAAQRSKERKLTRAANDLQYAANRAWHELDAVLRGPLAERTR